MIAIGVFDLRQLKVRIARKELDHEAMPTTIIVNTGVQRADGPPAFQAPPAMLPEPSPTNFQLEGDAPKEPSPFEQKRAEALEGVEPKWDAAPEPPKADTKLYYAPVIKRIGWR